MISYSSYGSTNNRAPSERTYHLETLAAEYRELQELRERVKKGRCRAAAEVARRRKKLVGVRRRRSPARPVPHQTPALIGDADGVG